MAKESDFFAESVEEALRQLGPSRERWAAKPAIKPAASAAKED